MKKYNIAADIHLHGVHEITGLNLLTPDENFILLGDIVDLSGCRKKDKHKAKLTKDVLLSTHGDNYITGNHDLGFKNKWVIKDKVLFTHGDYVFWSRDKANKYRKKNSGRSWFGRCLIWLGEHVRGSYSSWKTKDLISASIIAKSFDCHTIIVGHKHPNRVLDIKFQGVRCICVPRGITPILI